MSDKVGFINMAGEKATGEAPEIGVGMLGYAFMGKAHTNAFKKLPYMIYPPPAIPKLIAIAGRNEEAVREAAKRYGYEGYYTDWKEMLKDDRIQLFDNGGPNDAHAEPCIAAAQAGKHVLCEKPLARSAKEAAAMLEAVQKAGVVHMVAHNYRFVPALRLARDLIASGKLGEIYHFRAVYLQEWIMDPDFPYVWRLDKKISGSGTLGDLGSHIIDLARFLVGEPRKVSGMAKTFIKQRPIPGGGTGEVSVDDAFMAMLEFESGALGTLEASRFCAGRKNHQVIEINGSKGSLVYNLERFNELDVFWKDDEPRETQGFRNVLVSESYHPFWKNWWPQGHMIGWEHTFVHEMAHLFDAIVNKNPIAPFGADFEDGYKNAVICDAILASAEKEKTVAIQY
ncbi:MAG: Gfo/Idh/MocA family oxidoreductase [Anaerolineaceae bacterium]|nr:Gfo/Idh/MocA family oxidoreductase [Anaerolineaceae bacterium]